MWVELRFSSLSKINISGQYGSTVGSADYKCTCNDGYTGSGEYCIGKNNTSVPIRAVE